MSHLVKILLPLFTDTGRPVSRKLLQRTGSELTEKFGGLTAQTRAPVAGLWKRGGKRVKDDLLIYEVLTPRLDLRWWTAYRRQLEDAFKQKKILITVYTVRQL